MSNSIAVLLILVGTMVFAGIVLWLRDRFRDYRHIPETTRKLAERRSVEAATSVLFAFYFLLLTYQAIETTTLSRRIYYVSASVLCLWLCVRCFRNYMKIHVKPDREFR
jgi:hypothetical protein